MAELAELLAEAGITGAEGSCAQELNETSDAGQPVDRAGKKISASGAAGEDWKKELIYFEYGRGSDPPTTSHYNASNLNALITSSTPLSSSSSSSQNSPLRYEKRRRDVS